MSTVAILGAGTLGGAVAHCLAGRDCARAIRLIDTTPGVAGGKALDITQAGPVEGFDTRVTATADLDAVVGVDVLVLTGPVDAPENDWQGETASALLTQVVGLNRRAPIVCAGASHASVIAVAVEQLGLNRTRIIGTAPSALVSALRALIALEANASPAEVLVNLVGIPPSHPVVAWSSATVGGYPLEERLSAQQRARLVQCLGPLWPPGPYTLASAAVQVVTAMMTGRSRRVFSCYMAGDERESRRVQSVGVTVDRTGVETVLAPRLSRFEQVQLENAIGSR